MVKQSTWELGICARRAQLGFEDSYRHCERARSPGRELSVEIDSFPAGYIRRRIQPVIATHSLNLSAGVWKPSVLRGLSFNCLAIALS